MKFDSKRSFCLATMMTLVFMFLTSCGNVKNIAYFQNKLVDHPEAIDKQAGIVIQSKDMLSINDGRNLFKGKGIMLDGKRRMNCPYSVFFSQVRIQIAMREHFDSTDLLADSSYQVGNLVRRLVSIHVLKHPMSIFTA